MSEALLLEAEELAGRRQLREAREAFDRVEAAGADADRCAAGRWAVHMLEGSFAAAWRESDAIHARSPDQPGRLWRGEPIDGRRVMLRCLHGFGDAVQFLRYVPELAARASQVTVEVAPRFVELARCFAGVSEVITWGDDAPRREPAWNVQIEVMELPYLFRTTVAELPVAVRYLDVEPAPRGAERVQVGLAWSSGSWNESRSLPVGELWPRLALDGCDVWSLERGGTVAPEGLLVDGVAADSLIGLARRIAALDLVITVDTVVAHLAGALGVEAWVMLQYAADWRWMDGREDSPWYGSVRLFRQPMLGDWGSVVGVVQERLRERVQERVGG